MKWDTKLEDVSAQTKYPIGDGDHGAIKPEMYQNHGVPYIRVGDIKWDGRIDRSKMVYISEEVNKLNPKSFLYPGDIIISKTGATIGKVAIIPNDFTISNTTASIGKVSLDFTKANSRFVFWCMKSQNFQEQMWKVSHKSAQPGFNVKDLKIFKIPLPPLPTQQKIASILDAADTLRQKDKALLAKYDELTQSLFLDMFGDPVKNEKGWEKVSLSEYGSFKNGLNFNNTESGVRIKYLGVGDFKSKSRIDNAESLSDIELNSLPNDSYLLNDGDLVFVRSNGNRALVGRCVEVYPKNHKLTFSGFCIRYRINSQLIKPTYLSQLFRNKSFKNLMLESGQGANIQNINQQILSGIDVPLPSLTMQEHFVQSIQLIEDQKAIAQKSLKKSEDLFNSLLQKAFKGELV